ncbi:hypothetical protein T439DRAFT_355565 [Meredithblackwellia eburnea MCA 4105]
MVATSQFAALAVLASFAAPAMAVDASSFFPANLARRLSNSVPSLKRTPTPTTPQKRTLSDQLMELLRDAKVAAASPSASPSASAAWPSGSLNPSARRARRDLEEVKAQIRAAPWEALDDSLLCPGGATACPIFPRMGSYECIDTQSELESCGGCASKGEGEDCTQIKGAQGVTCQSGRCIIFTCQQGYKLERDLAKGRDRCRKSRKETLVA